ncbi:hypothetical protein AAFC00_000863 [Neodothiora populina]|uniref:Phosphotyrosine protein phosphatase I domain-containing protein n=1 Tax=Neodothiora populina TaxID=2781224 RepID=A0ABR3PM90_9PEZI
MADSATNERKPISVLFVCLGNICRSPMAEGVFRHMTNHTRPNAHPLVKEIDSCGTGAYHVGDAPDPRTMSVLSDHGITPKFYAHKARKFQNSDFAKFDYIFAMDFDNKDSLDYARRNVIKKGDLTDEEAGKVMLFGAWGGHKKPEEVDDPYYGGRNGFEIAYEQVERFSRNFVNYLESGRSEQK